MCITLQNADKITKLLANLRGQRWTIVCFTILILGLHGLAVLIKEARVHKQFPNA